MLLSYADEWDHVKTWIIEFWRISDKDLTDLQDCPLRYG